MSNPSQLKKSNFQARKKKYTSLLIPEYCFLTDFDQGFQNQINPEHAMKTNYILAFLKENMPS